MRMYEKNSDQTPNLTQDFSSDDQVEQPQKLTSKGPHVTGAGRPSIKNFLDSMSPEQKKAFYESNRAKAKARAEAKRQEREAVERQAKEMLPALMAEQMSQEIAMHDADTNYVPSREILTKLRTFKDSGLTTDEMRSRFFKDLTDRSWQRLMKFLFKDHVGQVEDLGLDILNAKKKALSTLEARRRTLRKEIKHAKKNGKAPPPAFFKLLADAEDRIMTLEMDVSKTLHSLGAVGEKSGAASLHLHFGTPRPKPEQEEKSVEGTVVPPTNAASLDALLNS